MTWHRGERAHLAHALRAAGPDAPTLCEGWQTRHLAAHLVLREGTFLTAAGIAVPALRARTAAAIERAAVRAAAPEEYDALVDRFAAGPARWMPLRYGGDAAQLIEFLVHHEDVRRAGPDPRGPRTLPTALEDAIWRQLRTRARMYVAASPVGVELAAPGRGHLAARRTRAGAVVVTGAPSELALYLLGREAQAVVEVAGTPSAVEAFMGRSRPR